MIPPLRTVLPPALLAAAALTLAACGSSTGEQTQATATATAATTTSQPDAPSSAEQRPSDDKATAAPPDAPRLPKVDVVDIRDGSTVDLASLAPSDKPMLVWFWAPHCPTCNAEAKGVEEFSKEHQGELTVVGLGAQDSLGQAQDFVEEHGLKTPRMLYDTGFDSWSHFGVNGQPAAILFDPDGAAREGWFGPFDEDLVLEKARALT